MRLRLGLCLALMGCPASDPTPGDGSTSENGSTSALGSSSASATSVGSSGVPGTSSGPATSSSGGTTSGPSATETGSSEGSTGGVAACDGEFPAMWQDGTSCPEPEDIQVHRYSDNTYILRQSLCTDFEGPFLYLLFGEDRVLLQDTGAGGVDVQGTVQGVIDEWLAEQGRASIELIVTNSHAHGDHVAGNGQFSGQIATTVVGFTQGEVQTFFEITDWPNEIVEYDLGGRVIDVIPIPGHQQAHIALYDHGDDLLLTGDTLYPGRLYISNFGDYVSSINRMVDHVAGEDACHVLGTHIEMTDQAGVDFEFGEDQHANEHGLPLTEDHLVELRDAVEAMGNSPVQEVHDDFIIFPL